MRRFFLKQEYNIFKNKKLGEIILLTFYHSKFKNRLLFNKMAEHNESGLHPHAMAVRYKHTNQYGGICGHGCAMGAERIAEVVECYTFLQGRENGGLCWFCMSLGLPKPVGG